MRSTSAGTTRLILLPQPLDVRLDQHEVRHQLFVAEIPWYRRWNSVGNL